MSKSKGNVAYPEPIVKVLGNDALRYYLLRETVFGQDGNFSREALITRYNADLANGLGNLASRVLTMIENYCRRCRFRTVPSGSSDDSARNFSRGHEACRKGCGYSTNQISSFRSALQEIWNFISIGRWLSCRQSALEDGDGCRQVRGAGRSTCTAPPKRCGLSPFWRIR